MSYILTENKSNILEEEKTDRFWQHLARAGITTEQVDALLTKADRTRKIQILNFKDEFKIKHRLIIYPDNWYKKDGNGNGNKN